MSYSKSCTPVQTCQHSTFASQVKGTVARCGQWRGCSCTARIAPWELKQPCTPGSAEAGEKAAFHMGRNKAAGHAPLQGHERVCHARQASRWQLLRRAQVIDCHDSATFAAPQRARLAVSLPRAELLAGAARVDERQNARLVQQRQLRPARVPRQPLRHAAAAKRLARLGGARVPQPAQSGQKGLGFRVRPATPARRRSRTHGRAWRSARSTACALARG